MPVEYCKCSFHSTPDCYQLLGIYTSKRNTSADDDISRISTYMEVLMKRQTNCNYMN